MVNGSVCVSVPQADLKATQCPHPLTRQADRNSVMACVGDCAHRRRHRGDQDELQLASCQVATWLGVGGEPERDPRVAAGAFRVRGERERIRAVAGQAQPRGFSELPPAPAMSSAHATGSHPSKCLHIHHHRLPRAYLSLTPLTSLLHGPDSQAVLMCQPLPEYRLSQTQTLGLHISPPHSSGGRAT